MKYRSRKLLQLAFDVYVNSDCINAKDLKRQVPFCSTDVRLTFFLALCRFYKIINALSPQALSQKARLLRIFLDLSLRRRQAISNSLFESLVKSLPNTFHPIKYAVLLPVRGGRWYFADVDVVIERSVLLQAISALTRLGFIAGNIDHKDPSVFIAYDIRNISSLLKYDLENPSYEMHFIAHHDWPDQRFSNILCAASEQFDANFSFLAESRFYIFNDNHILTRTCFDLTFPDHLRFYKCEGTRTQRYLTHMAEDFILDLNRKSCIVPHKIIHSAAMLASPKLKNRSEYERLFRPFFSFSSAGTLKFTASTAANLGGFIENKAQLVESKL